MPIFCDTSMKKSASPELHLVNKKKVSLSQPCGTCGIGKILTTF